jgi:DNA-binding IclR family transcriptional regulator
VLGAFTPERPTLTLGECAAAAELTKSSAHRLLASLESIGLVERYEASWRLGARVVRLATVRLGQVDLRQEASPRLRALGERFRAAVALSVPNGSDMIYIERHDGPDAYSPSARLGGLAPLWSGAAGRAVLARLSADERARRLAHEGWRGLPSDVQRRVSIEIDRAIERGYAADTGLFFDGIAGVAAAVCDIHGAPVAALSVIITVERRTDEFEQEMGEALVSVVTELEAILGSRDADADGGDQAQLEPS